MQQKKQLPQMRLPLKCITLNTKEMEPRIIGGHRYLCKKTVWMCTIQKDGREKKTNEAAYIEGKVYLGEQDLGYPDDTWHFVDKKNAYGYILDEKGQIHPWPYDPEHHSWCHSKWTDYFEEMETLTH